MADNLGKPSNRGALDDQIEHHPNYRQSDRKDHAGRKKTNQTRPAPNQPITPRREDGGEEEA